MTYLIVQLPCFLHATFMSIQDNKCSLTAHLLNVVKACIQVLWEKIEPSTEAKWLAIVQEIQLIEKLTADLRGTSEEYYITLTSWLLVDT